MSRLKLIDAYQLELFLLSLGFAKLRTKGSHSFYKHKDGRYTTIGFIPLQRFQDQLLDQY
jgi:predicted RNA binding protein YcfA (HicA-like mRNA interferase family)